MTLKTGLLQTTSLFSEKNNNNNGTCLKWVACNNRHKSQFFTAGPAIKRIDKTYLILVKNY